MCLHVYVCISRTGCQVGAKATRFRAQNHRTILLWLDFGNFWDHFCGSISSSITFVDRLLLWIDHFCGSISSPITFVDRLLLWIDYFCGSISSSKPDAAPRGIRFSSPRCPVNIYICVCIYIYIYMYTHT